MNIVLLKNISLIGLHWGAYTRKLSTASLLHSINPFIRERTRPRAGCMESYLLVSSRLFLDKRSIPIAHSMFASAQVKPVIFAEIYKLERLVDGLGALENRKTWGKAIVRVREEKSRRKGKL